MKEYKVIYKPYLLGPLAEQQVVDGSNGTEVTELNDTLNNYARDGWVVKSGGIIEDTSTAERVMFWVLLEKGSNP